MQVIQPLGMVKRAGFIKRMSEEYLHADSWADAADLTGVGQYGQAGSLRATPRHSALLRSTLLYSAPLCSTPLVVAPLRSATRAA